jgi:exportin-1
MLNVYKVMSTNISTAISQNGEIVAKQPLIKAMRVVKKESLNVISSWISKSSDPELVSLKLRLKVKIHNKILFIYKGCR